MVNYNLINQGIFSSITSSGTGNKQLTFGELSLLYDVDTGISGVNIINTDVLYLQLDMSNRILLDSVGIHISSSGTEEQVLSSVNFYYKNTTSGTYITCHKNSVTDYYYVDIIPDNFSPRYILITVENISCTIYEVVINNDDSIVNFGIDGTDAYKMIEQGVVDSIKIFNNNIIGTSAVNAYVSIDYNDIGLEGYVKLSSSFGGPFYGLDDGVIIDSNYGDMKYTWDLGAYDKTNYSITNNGVILGAIDYDFTFEEINAGYIDIASDGVTFVSVTRANNVYCSSYTRGKKLSGSGKYYFEIEVILNYDNGIFIGIGNASSRIVYDNYAGKTTNSYGYYTNGNKYYNAAATSYGNSYTTGNIIGCAIDTDSGKLWFSKNGVWQASGDPSAGTNPAYSSIAFTEYYVLCTALHGYSLLRLKGTTSSFSYSPPSGFSPINIPVISGTYTSPVLSSSNSSLGYLVVDGITASGTSISYSGESEDIEVRSSDISPVGVEELYMYYDDKILKADISSGVVTTSWKTSVPNSTYRNYTAIDNKRGRIAINYHGASPYNGYIYVYNRSGTQVAYTITTKTYYSFDVKMDFDSYGGLWAYGVGTANNCITLLHFSSVMSEKYKLVFSADTIYDLASELNGTGVWYTDKITNRLMHLSSTGATLSSISLNTPRALCGTIDNGCWVVDNYTMLANKYASDGNLILSTNLGVAINRLCSDNYDGFWGINSTTLYRVDSLGTVVLSKPIVGAYRITSSTDNVVVYSKAYNYIKVINKFSGNTVLDLTVTGNHAPPDIFFFNTTNHLENQNTGIKLPLSTDSVWGISGSLGWDVVKRSEYFLPYKRYHQTRVTLRSDNNNVPVLNKILIPPIIKIQDIVPQTSSNVYIQSNLPSDISDLSGYSVLSDVNKNTYMVLGTDKLTTTFTIPDYYTYGYIRSTIMTNNTGKYYVEFIINNTSSRGSYNYNEQYFGIAKDAFNFNTTLGRDAAGLSYSYFSGNFGYSNPPGGFYGGYTFLYGDKTLINSDVIMLAVDVGNKKLWFGRNGVWFDGGDPSTGVNTTNYFNDIKVGPYYIVWGSFYTNDSVTLNFGATEYAYEPPTGFGGLFGPVEENSAIFETNIKCWWGLEE